MSTSLAALPHDILTAILHTALDTAPTPSAILCVCRRFRDIGTARLYADLWFTSASQLRAFACAEGPRPVVAPRAVVVDLAGRAERGVLRDLCGALVKCRVLALASAGASDQGVGHDHDRFGEGGVGAHDAGVRLRCLRLQMHSYASDAAVDVLERGLSAVSPDTFAWTGPDPDHHFSTAIVPPVASCLLKHFSTWHHIRDITVTNVSFATGTDSACCAPLMGNVPSLRTLYIGQATCLHPQAVAGMLCQGRMARLDRVRLVDAYSESIWGPRLRRSDIEKAVIVLVGGDLEAQMAAMERVKKVVTCEKKTERIMGGDRVDGTHILN